MVHMVGAGRRLRRMLCRLSRRRNGTIPQVAPPARAVPLNDTDPLQAVYGSPRDSDGRPHAIINCPTDLLVSTGALAYGPAGFHPWVAVLKSVGGRIVQYEDSVLARWHEIFRPDSLSEFLLGRPSPRLIGQVPPSGSAIPFGLFGSIHEALQFDRRCVEHEGMRMGIADRTSIADGGGIVGPKTIEQGKAHLGRLLGVYRSIEKDGYIRQAGPDGDIRGFLLRRDEQYRVLVWSGQHRTAALAALGAEQIPVRLLFDHPIEARDVEAWPLIRSGDWSQPDALEYFHRLFDYDSSHWLVELDADQHSAVTIK